ncbi:uncharacterized protein LOC143848518 [Tasmannia lanceolata]|uniref:uncharacterized protein LOC143848518 n=1 Tax=Tasmannia lanceolata TaxID=3420 RepID=UPI0040628AE2
MVKAKCRQLAAIATGKGTLSSGSLINSSNSGIEGELDDDSWVVVRKQRITILVPPSPSIQSRPQSSMVKQIQTKPKRTTKSRSQIMTKKHCKPSRGDMKESIACHFKKGIQIVGRRAEGSKIHDLAASPSPTEDHLPLSTWKTTIKGSDVFVGESTLRLLDPVLNSSKNCGSTSRTPIGVSEGLNTRPLSSFPASEGRDSIPIYGGKDKLLLRQFSCLNACLLQNHQLRASNLDRKLKRAGGLSRWLVSQGLGNFIHMFQRENVDKLQLLNMTMGKLKDMGADAVGPRRKLIHAIDRLCQPYYI